MENPNADLNPLFCEAKIGFGEARTRAGVYSEHAAAEKRNEVERIPLGVDQEELAPSMVSRKRP